MQTRRAITALALLLACATPRVGRALDVSVSGAWSEAIDAADLQAGAGSNLIDTHASSAGIVTVAIAATVDAADTWRVEVRRTDTTWDAGVALWVHRTSDGTGPGSISGGGSYVEVGTTDAALFTGAGDRSSISLQFRITGMSVGVSPDAYLSTVTFTVVDT